ncbi:hypothetical protein K7711_44490 [Nocardia sp. CA2R105]|uniref:hypothetical protein n=1 Tax=Nocardia coffeae TaxID=2873381 RepID=UPI001CA64B49|nr:hypothetical protein [Nocardia coffeae]MBY8863591.1 hypothetical protein [Nocardia coffeae]
MRPVIEEGVGQEIRGVDEDIGSRFNPALVHWAGQELVRHQHGPCLWSARDRRSQ